MTNSEKVNKAIEEDDLIFVDGVLVKAIDLTGELLYYAHLSDIHRGDDYVGMKCNVNNVEILTYEEGV